MKKTILPVLVLLLGSASVSPAAEDTWTYKTDMPTKRLMTGGGTIHEKIYVIGGFPILSRVTSVVEMYDLHPRGFLLILLRAGECHRV
jgi:hypothetical protein